MERIHNKPNNMKKSISSLIDKVKIGRGYSGNLYCQICKKKFKSTQARVDRGGAKGRRTCSRECAGQLISQRLKMMWENPSEGLIEKLRASAIKRRGKGRIDKETKPEKIFREELEKRKIIFEQQFGFDGMMIADFFIPSLQAFIFVDGSYWHSLPSSKEKDWQQIAYVRSKGMKAYRFTDKQVFENISKCLDEVLEDSFQPFSFADLIDSFTILGIKTEYAEGDKLKQTIKDYRRMNKLLISGVEFYKYSNSEKIIKSIKDLLDTNIKIFMLVDKIQKNEHTKKDAKKLQDLNSFRAELCNALNREFKEREIIKT